jgi:hypothetical protein
MVNCLSFLAPSKRSPSVAHSEKSTHTAADHATNPYLCACGSFEPLPAYSHQKARLSQGASEDEKLKGIMKDVAATIESRIKSLDKELRTLSLEMWDLKEIQWQER